MLPEISIEQLIAKFDKELKPLEKTVLDGCAKDYADYKRMTGMRRGLIISKAAAIDLAKRQDEDDDFDG